MSGVDDFNDDLSGGGPSFKFDAPGATAKGMITDVEKRQQTDYKTGEKLFWDDGNPRMQYVISLADGTEEGTRIFAKGEMLKSIRDAVKESPDAKLEIGGELAVRFTELGEAQGKLDPPKLFKAKYTAPTKSAVAEDDLFD